MRTRVRNSIAALAGGALLVLALLIWRAPEVEAWHWRLKSGTPAMTTGPLTLIEPLHRSGDYFAVADLGNGAYAIGEPRYGQCNFSYLIVGTRMALLFDSGPGIHDIRAVTEMITPLPILALPSHLHFDHVGNLAQFDHVALPQLPALQAQVRDGEFVLGFQQFLGFVEGFKAPRFAVSRWIAPGSDIDLGDRRLTLLSVPGHTPDSVVLLDRNADRLFAGDFIYPSEIYAFLPGANLGDYARNAGRIAAELDSRSIVYGGHGCERLPNVEVPTLRKADVLDLETALRRADQNIWTGGTGLYPRVFPVNSRMKLLAKYPWMYP